MVYIEAQAACAANPLEWRLLGPDGGPLGIAESCNDLGRLVLPASGDYTVSVAASGSATGPYAFTVLTVPVEPATTITIGQAVTGNIDSIGEIRDFTFTATAGEVVDLKAQAGCSPNPVEWQLLGPGGSSLDIAETCNDIGRHVLPTAGVYTVRVAASGTATGPFAFTVNAAQ